MAGRRAARVRRRVGVGPPLLVRPDGLRVPRGGRRARRARLLDDERARAAASSTAPATATPACWPRRSPPSTTSPAGGPRSAWAPAGPQVEYEAFGIPFPPVGARLDLLDEYRGRRPRPAPRRGHRRSPATHVALTDARNEPRPVQADLPIWIGGAGERRTARIVAAHADGWNLPFVPPDALAAKRAALAEHCVGARARPRRDPHRRSTSSSATTRRRCGAQFGPRADAVRPGARHRHQHRPPRRRASAATLPPAPTPVNVALRAPWNPDALVRAATAVAALR